MKNHHVKIAVLVLFSAFFMISSAFAQEVTVTGKVVDNDTKEPLPGVSIVVDGTTKGTITNFDGEYSIDVNTGVILVYSYIGYSNLEKEVTSGGTMDVELSMSTESLDEVVIVGYGSVKKKDATGAVSSVKTEDFNRGVSSSPSDLIQGKVSGVMITNSSGDPGANTSIRIRGNSSVRSGNDPLIVVDGVPLSGGNTTASADLGMGNSDARNPLNFINPNDIASMDILKDASATAIYGSRGANGVIIITTKKGAGANSVEFNSSFSVSKVANLIDVYSADEFGAMAPNQDHGGDVNALDQIFRTAFTQNHNVAFTGGNEDLKYRLSLSAQDQEGVVKNSGLEKYTANLNASQEFFDNKLKIDINMITSHVEDQYAPITNDAGFEGSLLSNALAWNPTDDLYKSDGSYNQLYLDLVNPLAMLDMVNDNAKTLRVLTNVSASYKILPELTYKLNLGLDNTNSSRSTAVLASLFRAGISERGRASVNDLKSNSKLMEHTLDYNKVFSEIFRFTGMLGYSYQETKRSGKSISGQDFTYDEIDYIYQLQAMSQETRSVSSFYDPVNELQSFFGRVNFSLYDKFLVTATMRADGSSKFGENQKYGYFPSAALAYRISEEEFIPESFDDLKFRLGWGQTGNQEFPAGASQAQYEITRDGIVRSQFDNPDLRWETSTTFNLGVDFTMFDSRLSGTIEYFNKRTEDLLFYTTAAFPAPSSGRVWTNLDAEVLNTGVEIALSGRIVETKDFSFDLSANISFLTNELQNFNRIVETGGLHGQGMSGVTSQRFVEGQPLNVFYLLKFQGLDADGISIYDEDKQYVGDPNPNQIMGVSASLRYKSWDMIANFNGAFGHQVYNNTATSILVASNPTKGRNTSPLYVIEGESADNAISASTRYLEDGDFIRLNNLTIGYTFEDAPWVFKNARLSLTGQNLLLFTDYTGFDPEVNVNKAIDGVPSFGIDYVPYPNSRTFSFGLNVSF
ncbi:SusC/RagA family TonB-linked outer membrane protein [Draconibacterium halophilum]|uniref:TonB-dependent receptor n=1 Tax=Draconibacterium halophilum TaxID=2706887 RepID=A0A6C0RB77_9BACT|nr:TonB-dependent receptor [Draconibacterium halophilum]QIA07694.1 TonB-dependent receptor [Draconibacterium halophilum]